MSTNHLNNQSSKKIQSCETMVTLLQINYPLIHLASPPSQWWCPWTQNVENKNVTLIQTFENSKYKVSQDFHIKQVSSLRKHGDMSFKPMNASKEVLLCFLPLLFFFFWFCFLGVIRTHFYMSLTLLQNWLF